MMINTGERIKRLRGFRGLTCEELADRIDRTRPYLSSVENGHNPATRKLLRVIADALEVDLSYFVEGAQKPVGGEDELERLYYYSRRRGESDGIARVEMVDVPLLTTDEALTLAKAANRDKALSHARHRVACPAGHRYGAVIVLRMPDESLEPNIKAAETLVVSLDYEPKDGAAVVAVTTSDEVFVRTLERKNAQWHFLPLNRAFANITKQRDEILALWPVVMALTAPN